MFQLAPRVRRTQSADGGVLLDIHHGQMFRLNVVGSMVLELLESGLDEAQISAEIGRVCAMDIEIVRADVRDFIARLNDHHLLQVRVKL